MPRARQRKGRLRDRRVCNQDESSLRVLGRESGFPKGLRARVWSTLLSTMMTSSSTSSVDCECLELHPDERQVLLDTKRSFVSCYPPSIRKHQLDSLRDDLHHVITRVLQKHAYLHYYQGYHDIAQIILVVFGRERAVSVLEAITLCYLRDYMLPTLEPAISLLSLVPQIISICDPDLSQKISNVEPYYGIADLLTWWSHSLDRFEDACRVFDFMLSSEPVMIVYMVAARTVLLKARLMEMEDENECMLLLSQPQQEVDIEQLLDMAVELREHVMPKQLPGWRRISKDSCFKQSLAQSVQEAKAAFKQQEVECHVSKHKKESTQGVLINLFDRKNEAVILGFSLIVFYSAWYWHNNA